MNKRIAVLYCGAVPYADDYVGGMASIFNSYKNRSDKFSSQLVDITFQNSLVDFFGNPVGKVSRLALIKQFGSGVYLSKVAQAIDAEVVHLNSSRGLTLLKDLLVARTLKRRTHAKIVMSIHYAQMEEIIPDGVVGKMTIALFRFVDCIIFLSKEVKKQFEILSIAPQASKFLLYTFFDDEGERTTSVTKQQNTVLFMGSLDRRKGILDLIEAFSYIERPLKLIICGSGDRKIEKHLIDLSIKEPQRFDYRGYVQGNSKKRAFLDSNVICLPSYGEGLPIVILEGMSYGLVPVTTCVGAIPEIIQSGVNGYIVLPGDINGIKRAIVDALENWNEISSEAKDSASHFSVSRNIEALCNIYHALK